MQFIARNWVYLRACQVAMTGEGERVCGSADLAKNFVRIAVFNKNFSGPADPINVMDLDLGKKHVRITDSKHNCSLTADLSMAA